MNWFGRSNVQALGTDGPPRLSRPNQLIHTFYDRGCNSLYVADFDCTIQRRDGVMTVGWRIFVGEIASCS